MHTIKRILRRPIRRYLERSVAKLIKCNPQLKVVAISGSVGKTSTKFAVATVLSSGRRVLSNHSNYNSEFGLPLAIFELHAPVRITDVRAWLAILDEVRQKVRRPFPYDTLVLELGTDKPGDIAAFMRYLHPDIAVVTAITPEHMEFFGTLDAVGEEEFTLARHAKTVALHVDDPELAKRRDQLVEQRVLTYGASGEVHWADGDTLCLGGERGTIQVSPQIFGNHLRLSLLAAAAVGVELGLSNEAIQAGINAVEPVPGRMQRFDGVNGSMIIDDTYNSSPDAVLAALQTLYDVQADGRKIALLGQMNELGEYSRRAHEEVGKAAAKVDLLVTLTGDANRVLGAAAVKAGLKAERHKPFDSPYAAGRWLAAEVKPGDVVLIKGSQNRVFTEEATKLLLRYPEDVVRLVRQSPDWLAKKAAQFPDAVMPQGETVHQ